MLSLLLCITKNYKHKALLLMLLSIYLFLRVNVVNNIRVINKTSSSLVRASASRVYRNKVAAITSKELYYKFCKSSSANLICYNIN